MGQKDFFLKNWKKSTFSLFPLKGKPGDGEQKSEAKNRKSTQGTFFLRRAAICRGERPQKRRWKKTGNQVFFPELPSRSVLCTFEVPS